MPQTATPLTVAEAEWLKEQQRQQLADDRALAMLTLRPRQPNPPPYTLLTDSGRAEVDRIVALIAYVREMTLRTIEAAPPARCVCVEPRRNHASGVCHLG